MAPQDLVFEPTFLNPGFVPKDLLMKPPPVLSAPLEAGAYTSLHWKGYHCRSGKNFAA